LRTGQKQNFRGKLLLRISKSFAKVSSFKVCMMILNRFFDLTQNPSIGVS